MTHIYENFHHYIDAVKRYFFWDLETTGLSKVKGDVQIKQFGAIEADIDLSFQDSVNIKSKCLEYITPQPGAILTTRNTDFLYEGQSENEMAIDILKAFEECKAKGFTLNVQYNGQRFDEPILQTTLDRNLCSSYPTSMDGGSKCDMFTIVKLLATGYPEYNFPRNKKGNFSLGLAIVSSYLGLKSEDAHDALADSRMTLGIARHLKEEKPELFHTALVHGTKQGSLNMIRHSEEYMFSGKINYGKEDRTPEVFCGQGNTRDTANIVAMFDLNFPPQDILNMSEQELEDGGIGKQGSPIKIYYLNQTLPLIPINSLNEFPDFALPHEEYCKRAMLIKEDDSFQGIVSNILSKRVYRKSIPKTSEQGIYHEFPDKADVIFGEAFANASLSDRREMISNFSNSRWRDFARRIVISQDLPNSNFEDKCWYENLVAERLHNREYGVTNEDALAETIELLETSSADDKIILNKLKDFLISRKK